VHRILRISACSTLTDGAGLELGELAPGVDVDEVRAKTDAAFRVASPLSAMDA
jgi:acyl CoA:acetate/3-ketoacid CoA transferase beta subunit